MFTKNQNEAFGKLFDAIKENHNVSYRTEAVAMIDMNDANFTKVFNDSDNNVITGKQKDVDLVIARAKYLKLI